MKIEEYIKYRIKTLEGVKEGLILETKSIKENILSGEYGKFVPHYDNGVLQEVNCKLDELKEIARRFNIEYERHKDCE